jgi:hypothetical protein
VRANGPAFIGGLREGLKNFSFFTVINNYLVLALSKIR